MCVRVRRLHRVPEPNGLIVFRKAGVYPLIATNVQTRRRGVTLGEPNTLKLTVGLK